MEYYDEEDPDDLQTILPNAMSELDDYEYGVKRNIVPSPSKFSKGLSSCKPIIGNSSYQPSPYGWQPPSIDRQQSNTSELESLPSDYGTEYSDGFVYVDPEVVYSRIDTAPVSSNQNGKEICRKISNLLRDKDSPSRGSRMFQKRRKRAHKFTTIGYGTQPPNESERRHSRNEETSSSEELSRLDYTDDDEIAVYDKPGVHNVLTSSANLNPSDQLIQKQLKNLAMDVGGMRGKGAKIFAKRQQRMENYVITDENRKQLRTRSASTDRALPPRGPRDASQGPYVRPGSTIAITPKKPNYGTLPNNLSRGLSGYCTDVEDDYRSVPRPQVNYFSDCEGISSERPGRSRRTRPANRRSWEDDSCPEDNSSINNDINISQALNRNYQKPPIADYSSAGEESQSKGQSPFRRVLPPGRSPLMSPGRGSRDSSLNRTTSLSPARPAPPVEDAQQQKRTWSRVTFNPRKITPKPSAPTPVVDYPCDRSNTSQSKPPIASKGFVSRAPSQSPQRHLPNYTTSFNKPSAPKVIQQAPLSKSQPKAPPVQQDNKISNKQRATSNERQINCSPKENDANSATHKPGSAVSLLEKPMERVIKTTSHITPNKFVDTAPPSNNDFIGNTDFNLSDIVSSIQSESMDISESKTEKENSSEAQNKNDNTGCNEAKEEDENVRGSSPASVLSYVSSNSNSSTFTSMLPSRCLTPPARPFTPNGSRSVKIVSKNSTLEKPTRPTAYNNNVVPAVPPPAPVVPSTSAIHQPNSSSDEPPKGDKISACLKVLDPSKMLFKPKPQVQYQPSPTLNAILQSENEESYGSMKTPPMSYEYPCKKMTEVKSPPAVPKLVPKQQPAYSYQPPPSPSTKKRYSPPGQAPQPLGIIAEGMKGKGAKMFEKQLKRMQQYTKETSHEDFPELQSPTPNGSTSSPTLAGRFSYHQPRMAGFSPTGEKLEPGKQVKNSMREVMGEFQNGSKPGKAKRPSETKKKGRDPLYYQQQLFYRPPSANDFVEPPPEIQESQSDASSVTSSKTNTSSMSSFNADPRPTDVYLAPQQQDSNLLISPTASRSSLGGDLRSTNSSSSISSQKSVGPKTAPKPSKALITRQLSKPTSPPPEHMVSTSPTPEVQTFIPAPTSPPAENESFVFQGTEDKDSKCIENLIQSERIPDDRYDGSAISNDSGLRRRVMSIEQTNGYSHNMEPSSGYPVGIQPPSYDDVVSTIREPEVKKMGGFSVSKPKFNIKNNGVQVQMWKPGQ